MKMSYYTAASLDGFIATTDDALAWLFPLADINATSTAFRKFVISYGRLLEQGIVGDREQSREDFSRSFGKEAP